MLIRLLLRRLVLALCLGALAVPAGPAVTAGSLLREARAAAGLHIAALAVSLKVPVRKLEALEADRLYLLPDGQTVLNDATVRVLGSTYLRLSERIVLVEPSPEAMKP